MGCDEAHLIKTNPIHELLRADVGHIVLVYKNHLILIIALKIVC